MDSAASKKIINILIWTTIFLVFTVLMMRGVFEGLNADVSAAIMAGGNGFYDRIFLAFRSFGNYNICLTLVVISSAVFFSKRSKKTAIAIILLFFLLIKVEDEMKIITKHPRPVRFLHAQKGWVVSKEGYIKGNYSYPSGHTVKAFFAFSILALAIQKLRWPKAVKEIARGVLFGLIILVGYSSIYVGAHWLSDILGSYMLGYVFFLIPVNAFLMNGRAAPLALFVFLSPLLFPGTACAYVNPGIQASLYQVFYIIFFGFLLGWMIRPWRFLAALFRKIKSRFRAKLKS